MEVEEEKKEEEEEEKYDAHSMEGVIEYWWRKAG